MFTSCQVLSTEYEVAQKYVFMNLHNNKKKTIFVRKGKDGWATKKEINQE